MLDKAAHNGRLSAPLVQSTAVDCPASEPRPTLHLYNGQSNSPHTSERTRGAGSGGRNRGPKRKGG